MKVRELIAELQRHNPELEVCIYDHEADDDLPVVEAMHEDATTHVMLLTSPSGGLSVHKYGSCGGVCDLCGDQAVSQQIEELLSLLRAARDGEAHDFTANIHKVWAKLAEADARRAGCVCSAAVRADPSHDPSCRLRVRNAEPKD